MPVHDDLGIRMKTYYEQVSKTTLLRRMPVAIRIDGKAFHTFTRGFEKPFDTLLVNVMQQTTKKLCENIQNCVFGYTQSDEITLILVDYKDINTAAWFNYEVQKLCSISASMATLYFNKFFKQSVEEFDINSIIKEKEVDNYKLLNSYKRALNTGAMFDSRCFNIPKEEVCNLIYWRQLDATRNSIQMVGQANFSHKELQGLTCNKIQDKLLTEKDINWNNYPTYLKRGTSCLKKGSEWTLDMNMPILKGEDRKYVEDLIFI